MKTKKKGQEIKKSQRATKVYNKLPVKVSRKEFNRFIKPYLSIGERGPDPNISWYRIFNHILYVLHTGIQWQNLPCQGIVWQNVYRHHNHWSKDGSYKKMFECSVLWLKEEGKLDLSILHGDGSNTVAKKGARASAIRGTNIRREKNR